MLNFETSDNWKHILLKMVLRLLIGIVAVVFALYLALASTMGSTIAEGTVIAGIELDILIRLGTLLLSACLAIAALIWCFWPLLCYLYKNFIRR